MVLFLWHAPTQALICCLQHDGAGQPTVGVQIHIRTIEAWGCQSTADDFAASLPPFIAPGEAPPQRIPVSGGHLVTTSGGRDGFAAARALERSRRAMESDLRAGRVGRKH